MRRGVPDKVLGFQTTKGSRWTSVSVGRLGCILALICLSVCINSAAKAADAASGVESDVTACLVWQSSSKAGGCPDASRITQAVEDLVGRRVFVGPGQCDVTVRGEAKLNTPGAGWTATLSMFGRDGQLLGERELQGPDTQCQASQGPVSLVLAMMVEIKRKRARVRVPSAPAPASSPSPVAMSAPESTPPRDWSSKGWRSDSLFGLAVTTGLLPGVSVGPRLALGLDGPGFVPLIFDLTMWTSTREAVEGRGGTFWAWHAGASVCPTVLGKSQSYLRICFGGQAGLMFASGAGLDVQRDARRTHVHGEARVQGRLHLLGPFGLAAGLGLAVPLSRPTYVYFDNDGIVHEVFRPWLVAPLGTIGIDVQVPP